MSLEPMFKTAIECGALKAKIGHIRAVLETPMSAKNKIKYIERLIPSPSPAEKERLE